MNFYMPSVTIHALAALLLVTSAMAAGICNMSSEGFDECRPAVTGPSPIDPTAACCSALEAADLPCLCSYRSSPLLPSIGINPDLALQLPRECNLSPPANC
ncbi:hypothetical protein KSP40_PGU005754 [Platanthera guangdongensis]|uniref:Bifunctional inhibitor/plant lipid transfer protein/seed storage helical domain-containing protein n=1 Tax=Platanthera guangdongensis TaxID=2320717 RepID=A0ABR2LM76_9ASPA